MSSSPHSVSSVPAAIGPRRFLTPVAWILTTLGWLAIAPLAWFLVAPSAFFWLLGQSWSASLALGLVRIGFVPIFGASPVGTILTLVGVAGLPPVLTGVACRQWGAKAVLPMLALSGVLLPITQIYGRIDTFGNIATPLEQAVEQGNVPQARGAALILVRRYYQQGWMPNHIDVPVDTDPYGKDGFFLDGGDFVRSGLDPGVADSMGTTPLMSVLANPDYVRLLISAGADVNARNRDGRSVLQLAGPYPEVQQMLREAGAKE